MSKPKRFKKVVEHDVDMFLGTVTFTGLTIVLFLIYIGNALWEHSLFFSSDYMHFIMMLVSALLGLKFYMDSREVSWEEQR